MSRVYQHQQDQLHVRSKANGDLSLDVITLKQSATVYEAGTVVVAEYTIAGETQTATGLYVSPTAAGVDVSAYDVVIAAVINDRVDASAANHAAVAIIRDAEVYGGLITLKSLAGAEKTAVAAALAAAHVVLR
ncbi:hypothetical protein HFN53_17055 [Rhizobium leguminosarum]|nr:hypothetical protein [Rhizobium leguminosarum]